MKFKVNKTLLANALARIRPATDGKSLAILRGVLIDVSDNSATLTATNLDMTMTANVDVETEEAGKLVVDYAKFSAFVSSMPVGVVSICTNVVKATGCSRLEISCGECRATTATTNPDEFPKAGDISGKAAKIEMDAAALVRPFLFSRHAYATDKQRSTLMGAIVEIGKKRMTVLGTDGKRMAVCGSQDAPDKDVVFVTIPTKLVNAVIDAVRGSSGTWRMACDGKMLRVESESVAVVQGKLLANPPPNWRHVVPSPESLPIVVKADRAALSENIRRAGNAANDVGDSICVMLTVKDGVLTVQGNDGQNTVKSQMKVEQNGGEIEEMYLNPDFICQAIDAQEDDEIKVMFSNEHSPLVVTGCGECDVVEVLMPLRIK